MSARRAFETRATAWPLLERLLAPIGSCGMLLVAHALLACGHHPIAREAPPSETPESSTLAPPSSPPVPFVPPAEPADDPPPLASARPAGPGPLPSFQPCRPMFLLSGECVPRPADDAFADETEVRAWFVSRGTQRPEMPTDASAGACFVLPAAGGGDEAMVCTATRIEQRGGTRMTGRATYRRVDRVLAFVVTGRRPVKVLDAPLLFDAMDKEDLTEGPLFSLKIARDAAGKPVVREPSEGACERARAKNAESQALAGAALTPQLWARFDLELVERLCRAAGKGAAPRSPSTPGSRSSF